MNWQLLFLVLLTVAVASCKREKTPPPDSPEVFSPYSAGYAGIMHYQNFDESSWNAPPFDTTYQDVLTVHYPDSLHVNFHLAYWDVIRGFTDDSLYYFEKDFSFSRNSLNTYVENVRHDDVSFTIRGDSLLVSRFQISGCCPGYQIASFAGIRQ